MDWASVISAMTSVALRKESVDRNSSIDNLTQGVFVALRKESVDRNPLVAGSLITLGGSLSARRAWIEIGFLIGCIDRTIVALRKESVDRNSIALASITVFTRSLSARRAWIEIGITV